MSTYDALRRRRTAKAVADCPERSPKNMKPRACTHNTAWCKYVRITPQDAEPTHCLRTCTQVGVTPGAFEGEKGKQGGTGSGQRASTQHPARLRLLQRYITASSARGKKLQAGRDGQGTYTHAYLWSKTHCCVSIGAKLTTNGPSMLNASASMQTACKAACGTVKWWLRTDQNQ